MDAKSNFPRYQNPTYSIPAEFEMNFPKLMEMIASLLSTSIVTRFDKGSG